MIRACSTSDLQWRRGGREKGGGGGGGGGWSSVCVWLGGGGVRGVEGEGATAVVHLQITPTQTVSSAFEDPRQLRGTVEAVFGG